MNADTTEQPVVLDVRGLVKRFGDQTAVDGVSFTVREGEVVAVLGPSGSGKSTLVRTLHQLESMDGGAAYLDGELLGYEVVGDAVRPLADRSVDRQRRRMGMVFQQFNLFPHWTVLRNITEGPIVVHGWTRARAEERARELLAKIGLADKESAHPRQLSGGQQQRVAIARAIAVRPRILLFDEPTSSLDPELVDEVLGVMRDLANLGMTMIVVTHELGFARDVADRCIFMAEGSIVEEAPAEQFFTAPRTDRLRAFLTRSERSPERSDTADNV